MSNYLGKFLRHLREKEGKSGEQVASETGMSRSYLQSVERGEYSMTVERASLLGMFYTCNIETVYMCLYADHMLGFFEEIEQEYGDLPHEMKLEKERILNMMEEDVYVGNGK